MSELRSALEALRREVLAEVPDTRLRNDFAELRSVAEQLQLEAMRRLAEIERRGLHEADGHLSAVAWLASTHRVAWGAARQEVRTATELEAMPATRTALEGGDVTLSAVRPLIAAREAEPEAFARDEGRLVEAARVGPVDEVGRVVASWRGSVERERGVDREAFLRSRRRLDVVPALSGLVRLDGALDPETGETVITALRAIVDAEARGRGARPRSSAGVGPGSGAGIDAGSGSEPAVVDERTPAQRRADALGEICRQWLDRQDRPTVGGERPHLTVTISAEALAAGHLPGEAGGAGVAGARGPGDVPGEARGAGVAGARGLGDETSAELDHAGPTSVALARRLACDATVMRVVLAEGSEPLDVGRRAKVVPPGMRRAVIVRDRRCRFPGCGRPHPWCDAHHVVHWADGGPTALANLVLVCRHHHRAIHAGRASVEMLDGHPVFRRPDGTVLEEPVGGTGAGGTGAGGTRAGGTRAGDPRASAAAPPARRALELAGTRGG
jgi:Domain of unknown function (DUF222)/HNH endonuclease